MLTFISFLFLCEHYEENETAIEPHVYWKGAPNGVGGHAGWGGSCRGGVEWVMQGWGESYRGRLSHAGVGWGGSYRGGVGHAGVGCGGSCRGGVGHTVEGWVMQGCSGSYRGRVGWVMQGQGWSYMGCNGVCKISQNNLICHKLGILSFLLTNYFMNQPPHSTPAWLMPPHPTPAWPTSNLI